MREVPPEHTYPEHGSEARAVQGGRTHWNRLVDGGAVPLIDTNNLSHYLRCPRRRTHKVQERRSEEPCTLKVTRSKSDARGEILEAAEMRSLGSKSAGERTGAWFHGTDLKPALWNGRVGREKATSLSHTPRAWIVLREESHVLDRQ